jgi:DNA-binding transcriptional regulator YiaG
LRPTEVVAIRRRFGLNRVQFGRLVGVSTWTVFMWEHGKVAPSSDSANRLRQVAKMNPKAAFARAVKPKASR